jgi:hypothetical protein
MLRMNLCLSFMLLTSFTWAQVPSIGNTEQAAVGHAKSALVSSLDNSLPKVSLEFFLNYESGGADIHWEVNDCGEQTGSPGTDRASDAPMCVEAAFTKDQTDVTVTVAVGTFQKGPSGKPTLFGVTVHGPTGRVHSLRLGDLPKELHRPTRGMPRDLPIPITAFSEGIFVAPSACSRPA